jgi:hypothetical protein
METRGLDTRVSSLLELEPRFGGAFFRPRTGLQPRHDSQTIGGSTDRLTGSTDRARLGLLGLELPTATLCAHD